jgi:large subunit ribosomal protein L22
MKTNYSFNDVKENMARASGRSLNVSFKQAVEICSHIRGRPLSQAKMLLNQAINMDKPIPFKRFTNGLGHKPGIGPGRYHPKACAEILKVIESAESNAKNKGMNSADLKLLHIAAQTAPKQWHYGRKKRSVFKAAHIEVVLEEVKGLGKPKNSDKRSDSIKSDSKKIDKKSKSDKKSESKSDKKSESK